ncbi:hypothetical protein [Yinghuangia seranimata]|uniref:hypothetical protein n=1 Tax=Yinghuangia seranimata TaxID=408067 RepID=UPI00248C0961|nr:hypothetical protein [Yinghuangia seranimata]MDI2132504.1 hypothetical protein [Yinghuangia seranimata]
MPAIAALLTTGTLVAACTATDVAGPAHKAGLSATRDPTPTWTSTRVPADPSHTPRPTAAASSGPAFTVPTVRPTATGGRPSPEADRYAEAMLTALRAAPGGEHVLGVTYWPQPPGYAYAVVTDHPGADQSDRSQAALVGTTAMRVLSRRVQLWMRDTPPPGPLPSVSVTGPTGIVALRIAGAETDPAEQDESTRYAADLLAYLKTTPQAPHITAAAVLPMPDDPATPGQTHKAVVRTDYPAGPLPTAEAAALKSAVADWLADHRTPRGIRAFEILNLDLGLIVDAW